MRLFNLALAGAAAALLAAPAMAATVADASFEVPEQGSSFTYNPTVTDATFSGGSGVQGNGSAWGFADAPDGVQTAFLQNVAAISLQVTDLTVGDLYDVSFFDALRNQTDLYAPNPFSVFFGTTLIGSFTPGSTAWTANTTGAFLATDTTGVLTFQSLTEGGDHDVGIDAIVMNDHGAGGVPEPAAWALMILGFGSVGAALRRRTTALAA